MKQLILLVFISLLQWQANAEKISGKPLRFHADGTFTIVQFTDIHAGKDLKRDEPVVETINMDTWVRLGNYRVIDWKTIHFPSSFLQQEN